MNRHNFVADNAPMQEGERKTVKNSTSGRNFFHCHHSLGILLCSRFMAFPFYCSSPSLVAFCCCFHFRMLCWGCKVTQHMQWHH